MDSFNTDILLDILEKLSDRDKFKLLLTCQFLNSFYEYIFFNEAINFKNVNYKYYDRFTNVLNVKSLKINLPGYIKASIDNCNFIEKERIQIKFPKYVKSIFFSNDFNNNIKDAIPKSVTHLTFGDKFDQDIKDALPNNITHLKFGECFNISR